MQWSILHILGQLVTLAANVSVIFSYCGKLNIFACSERVFLWWELVNAFFLNAKMNFLGYGSEILCPCCGCDGALISAKCVQACLGKWHNCKEE